MPLTLANQGPIKTLGYRSLSCSCHAGVSVISHFPSSHHLSLSPILVLQLSVASHFSVGSEEVSIGSARVGNEQRKALLILDSTFLNSKHRSILQCSILAFTLVMPSKGLILTEKCSLWSMPNISAKLLTYPDPTCDRFPQAMKP